MESPADAGAGEPAAVPEWAELALDLEVMESAPPQYAVRATTEAPTGGWSLRAREVVDEGEGAFAVTFVLEGPPPDAMVTQAITPLEARAGLGAVDGAGSAAVTLVVERPAVEASAPVEAGALSWD